jgi:acyl-CoA thioesterase
MTRAVKAVQRSRCIFTLLISFHKPEANQPILQTNIDLSGITPPEECQSAETRLENYLNDNRDTLSAKMLLYLEREIEENRFNAIEHRNTRSKRFDQSSNYETW